MNYKKDDKVKVFLDSVGYFVEGKVTQPVDWLDKPAYWIEYNYFSGGNTTHVDCSLFYEEKLLQWNNAQPAAVGCTCGAKAVGSDFHSSWC